MRWINRDPIEENGGINLYMMCENNALSSVDSIGQDRYITSVSLLDPFRIHAGVAVDLWVKKFRGGKPCCWYWKWVGIARFDYRPDFRPKSVITIVFDGRIRGRIDETLGENVRSPRIMHSSPEQDQKMLQMLHSEMTNGSTDYNVLVHNCWIWALDAISYGLDAPDEIGSCANPRIVKPKSASAFPELSNWPF